MSYVPDDTPCVFREGPEVPQTAHAKLSPSKGDRWTTCTAAPYLEADMPEQPPSEYALEGTEAHALLERCVNAVTHPAKLEPDHPAVEAVGEAYDFIEGYLRSDLHTVLSEQKVTLCEDCWGTADLIVIGRGELHVIDYKHGAGVAVDIPSTQLEIYAAAALKDFGWMAEEPIERVFTVIIQPRAAHPDGPIRGKQYSPEEITARGQEIVAIAEQIKKGDVKFCPSEKACRWCAAEGNCKAQQEMAFTIAKSHFTPADENQQTFVEAPAPDTVQTLSVEEKAAILAGSSFVSNFLKAVEETARREMESGVKYPGLKLVAGRANRKWGKDETDVIDVLVTECKLKRADIMPPKLLGPAGVEKLIDVKKRNGQAKMDALQAIIVKPEGEPTIVPESDKRPSIEPHFEPVNDPLA